MSKFLTSLCLILVFIGFSSIEVFAESRYVDGLESFCIQSGFKREYRAWLLANERLLLWAGGAGDGYSNSLMKWSCSFNTEEIKKDDYGRTVKNWFPEYKNVEEFDRKWKNKPRPDGFTEFMKTAFDIKVTWDYVIHE